MRRSGYIFALFIVAGLLISASLIAGPRLDALGGIYSISPRAVEGPGGNPAIIAAGGNNHTISAHATRYWLGLPGDALYSSRIAWTTPHNKWGSLGLELRQFGLGIQSSFGVGAGYAYLHRINEISEVSGGLFGRWIRNQYNLSGAYRLVDDPLFNEYGDAVNGFGLDCGATYTYDRLSSGFVWRNIIRPGLSLEGGTGEGNAEPMEISIGLAYSPIEWLTPTIQGGWHESEGLLASVGAEFSLFDGLMSLRTGYREGNFTFGLGLNGSIALPFNFDYALCYPDGALSNVGVTTHSIGITAAVPRVEKVKKPSRVPWIDIITRREPTEPDTLVINLDEESQFRAIITNAGTAAADSFYVVISISPPEPKIIGEPVLVRNLEPGDEFPLEWTFTPIHGGVSGFVISADDDGKMFPDTNGLVGEINEINNRLDIPFYIAGEILASISIEYAQLELTELTYIAEEEPLVPLVFFEEGSSRVTDRFESILQILAQRLDENRDIVLELRGFVDDESDPSSWERAGLHLARSVEVKRRLVEFGAPGFSVEIIEDGYSPIESRAGTGSTYGTTQDRLWVEQENRRVEMMSWVRDYKEPIISINFDNDKLEVPQSTLDSLSMFACEANIFLEENPEISLVLEGYTSDKHNSSEVFTLLDELRRYILVEITCPIDAARFPIIVGSEDRDKTSVDLLVTGEAVIYRPKEAALVAKDFKIPEDMKENKVAISIESGWVSSFEIIVVDSDGITVNTLSKGDGVPPELLLWDWCDSNGNLVDPRKTYHIDLITIDIAKGISRFSSEEMNIIVTGIEKRNESAIIVQFAFDEITSTSKYLESRLEYMAQRVKNEAADPKNTLTVKIIGHTDPIGSDRRNIILSQDRALKEERNIRRYLRYVTGVKTDAELDSWLSAHNATLVRQGLADTEPYEVERYRDGKFEKVLLGNNAFPEGRAVNRRVVIQIEEIRSPE